MANDNSWRGWKIEKSLDRQRFSMASCSSVLGSSTVKNNFSIKNRIFLKCINLYKKYLIKGIIIAIGYLLIAYILDNTDAYSSSEYFVKLSNFLIEIKILFELFIVMCFSFILICVILGKMPGWDYTLNDSMLCVFVCETCNHTGMLTGNICTKCNGMGVLFRKETMDNFVNELEKNGGTKYI